MKLPVPVKTLLVNNPTRESAPARQMTPRESVQKLVQGMYLTQHMVNMPIMIGGGHLFSGFGF